MLSVVAVVIDIVVEIAIAVVVVVVVVVVVASDWICCVRVSRGRTWTSPRCTSWIHFRIT